MAFADVLSGGVFAQAPQQFSGKAGYYDKD